MIEESAQVLSSETVFDGLVFQAVRDRLIEPGGKEATRDIIPPQRQRGDPGR